MGNIPGVGSGQNDNGNLYNLEVEVILKHPNLKKLKVQYWYSAMQLSFNCNYIIMKKMISFMVDQLLPMSLDGGASSGTAMIDMNDDNLLDFVANRGKDLIQNLPVLTVIIFKTAMDFPQHEIDIYNDSEGITISDHNRDGNIDCCFRIKLFCLL